MKRKTWMTGLTEKERKHLRESGARTKAGFSRNVTKQKADWAKTGNNPVVMPCWECRNIARKLGLWE